MRGLAPRRLILSLVVFGALVGTGFASSVTAAAAPRVAHNARAVASAPTGLNIMWFSQNSSCTVKIDPITVIYYPYGDYTEVGADVSDWGWSESVIQWSKQYFYAVGNCGIEDTEYESATVFSTRYHVRVGHCIDSGCTAQHNAFLLLLTPHHEHIINPPSCWHAVDPTVNGWSGFDSGRKQFHDHESSNLVLQELRYVGNTKNIKQCDGGMAGSNGYVRFYK